MDRFFEFKRHKTGYRQETLAGVTTFITMTYIIMPQRIVLQNIANRTG